MDTEKLKNLVMELAKLKEEKKHTARGYRDQIKEIEEEIADLVELEKENTNA